MSQTHSNIESKLFSRQTSTKQYGTGKFNMTEMKFQFEIMTSPLRNFTCTIKIYEFMQKSLFYHLLSCLFYGSREIASSSRNRRFRVSCVQILFQAGCFKYYVRVFIGPPKLVGVPGWTPNSRQIFETDPS